MIEALAYIEELLEDPNVDLIEVWQEVLFLRSSKGRPTMVSKKGIDNFWIPLYFRPQNTQYLVNKYNSTKNQQYNSLVKDIKYWSPILITNFPSGQNPKHYRNLLVKEKHSLNKYERDILDYIRYPDWWVDDKVYHPLGGTMTEKEASQKIKEYIDYVNSTPSFFAKAENTHIYSIHQKNILLGENSYLRFNETIKELQKDLTGELLEFEIAEFDYLCRMHPHLRSGLKKTRQLKLNQMLEDINKPYVRYREAKLALIKRYMTGRRMSSKRFWKSINDNKYLANYTR